MPVRSFNQLGPPTLITPQTITDPNPSATSIWIPDDPTYGPSGLDPGKDYVLLGNGRRNRGIQVTGGRNIAAYKFDCVLGADNTMLLFTNVQGVVHVQQSYWDPNGHEGDLFKTSGNSDNTIIQIKGALCKTKLLGSTDPGHVHADFAQTSGGFKECWFEDCEFHTAFDGMMMQREANVESMTSADFFPVTQLTKSGNIATAKCPNHNFVVGEAVGIWGASTSGWNGGWTVLSVSGTGTNKVVTFQLGDTLPANLGTGAGTVAQIVRFAWGYKDGKIRINRVHGYGENSGTGLPPSSALQMIRFGARAAPVPNSGTNPVGVAGYTRQNEDRTPLTLDWFNGDLLAQQWYGSPPGTQDIGQFVEPDSNANNYSGVRPVLHSPAGAARYIDWPNNPKVLSGSRLTEGLPPGGEFVTGTGQGNLVLTDPGASYDTGAGGGVGGGCIFAARSVPDGTAPNTGPKPESNFASTVVKRETLIGRTYGASLFFAGGDAPGAGSYVDTCVTGGRVPIIKWSGGEDLTSILNASLDASIRTWAVKLRALPQVNGVGPIFVWFQEYNLHITAAQATDFKNCFKRVYTILNGTAADITAYNASKPVGAVNITVAAANPGTGADTMVETGWCPNHLPQAGGPTFAASYPGNDYVWWACPDLYNKNPTNQQFSAMLHDCDSPSIDFYNVYSQQFATSGRKVRLGNFESGCRWPNDPGITGTAQTFNPDAWITNARNDLKLLPEFELFTYWDCWANQGDWRFTSTNVVAAGGAGNMVQDTNPSSNAFLAAYIAMGLDDYYAGTGAPPPPPPPPPPPTGTYWDIDFGVNAPSATPYGFDSIPNAPDPVAGTVIEVVAGTGPSNPIKQVGVGLTQTGFGTTNYNSEKTIGIPKPGIISTKFNWCDWQATAWNVYDNSVLTAFDTAVNYAATETAAGRPVKIILRMVTPPMGGTNPDGTTRPSWMIGPANANNNNRPVPFWQKIDTDGGSHVPNVPINWNTDFTYNDNYIFHYQNAMQQLNTYLGGSTAGGNRRADYVLFVPVVGPTDSGSEMPIDFGSGAASFNPPVTINGVTYGNDTNGAPSVPDISVVNRATAKNLMPATVAADTQTAQNTWMSDWWHNMSGAPKGSLANGDGSWMKCIAISLAQANFDSCVAYGTIMSDSYSRANDILSRQSAGALKTRLWTMQTNLRVRPPGGDFSRPINEWTYANWSLPAANHFLLALALASPAIPLIFMQTAFSSGVGGNRGTPPSDWARAVDDGVNTYKAQGIETYGMAVFNDPTYGAANVAEANTAIGQMATTAGQVATGGVTRGQLHIIEVAAVANGPIGRKNLPSNATDAWFRFVVDSLTTPSATVTIHLSKSSGATGDLAIRVDTNNHLLARWSGGAVDWTDTNALQAGDVVDIRHVLNGATSGYEVWVNNALRKSNMLLSATAASVITYGQLGLSNAANVEGKFYRYGAASTRMGTPQPLASPSNADSPAVAIITPAAGTTYNTSGTKAIAVTASDNDNLSAVEVRVDGGGWQTMTLSGSQYTANVSLSGTAGQSVQHVIDVRATDAYAVVAQRLQTIQSVTVFVNIVGADTTPPTLTVTTPASNIVVGNAVTSQSVVGVATDNVAISQVTVNGVVQILDASGNFNTTVPLNVGSNVINVQATDAAGNVSPVSRTVTRQDVVLISPPTVVIGSPPQGQTYPKGTRALTLTGTATDPVAIQSVTYNVDGSGEIPLTLINGAFTQQVSITAGNHTITVTATNVSGLTDNDARNFSVPLDDAASSDTAFVITFGKVIVRA